MSKTISYNPKGVCCQEISISLDGDTINSVEFVGGCHGNLQGIASLVKGRDVSQTIASLKGIRCRTKETSCPDQLALALESMRE